MAFVRFGNMVLVVLLFFLFHVEMTENNQKVVSKPIYYLMKQFSMYCETMKEIMMR